MTAAQMSEHSAVKAQADLLHAYFLGLQLSVATQEGSTVMGDWMFSLFRRQHHEKFLSSFAKLGLSDLPHAVACAQYHVLSNNIGGVGVEYMAETDRKAWVRFRYPRWMYHGPVICGVPVEVSRGFLRGWYAHNGVSLGNPRLGFVCVSEDMTGDYGFIGYFQEYDHDLSDEERLQFEPDAVPPPFVGEDQPQPPPQEWNEARLEKANRNYALEYVRNGLAELAKLIGKAQTEHHAHRTARLIGLQYYPEVAAKLAVPEGDIGTALQLLARLAEGMGDAPAIEGDTLHVPSLRAARGLEGVEQELVVGMTAELWRGLLRSQQVIKDLEVLQAGHGLTVQVRHRF